MTPWRSWLLRWWLFARKTIQDEEGKFEVAASNRREQARDITLRALQMVRFSFSQFQSFTRFALLTVWFETLWSRWRLEVVESRPDFSNLHCFPLDPGGPQSKGHMGEAHAVSGSMEV
jgi:hypothetical protein